MPKPEDAHWASVPMQEKAITPPLAACMGLSTLIGLALLAVTAKAEDPYAELWLIGPMMVAWLGLFGFTMVAIAKRSHANGSRPRAKYGRCVVLVHSETHGPFPDEDAANAWANGKFDNDTYWSVRPLSTSRRRTAPPA